MGALRREEGQGCGAKHAGAGSPQPLRRRGEARTELLSPLDNPAHAVPINHVGLSRNDEDVGLSRVFPTVFEESCVETW